jgi:hypothetical protein
MNHQMDPNRPWQQNVRFEDEVWVFDVGALGRASLIVSFHQDGDTLTANLFDDKDGDGQVRHRIENGHPRVTESPYWTVRVIAPDGWWLKGGKINFNLKILVDGPLLVTFGSDLFINRLSTDGVIDYEVLIRDRDGDGRPDYELRNAYPPVPESWGVYRSILIVSSREGDAPIENFVFWPYLGSSGPLKGYEGGKLPTTIFYDTQGRAYGIVKDYGTSFSPIQVDWNNARINYVGEFVASRGSDKNWFIQSITPIRLGQLNTPNFENPFAFYDLAMDRDGIPELQVRVQYFGPNDPYYLDRRSPMAYENIRYSWDQDNDQTWDYKVDLVGRHIEDAVVGFPEFSVRTIPYEQLPYWVTENEWDVAAFVSWEMNKSWSSEGIYEWGASIEMERYYIPGITDSLPTVRYDTIAEGFRGEYKFEIGQQPVLYFSSLDHKLHLLNAEAGVWNIDGNAEIRYANLDGDAYLDQWLYLERNARRWFNLAGACPDQEHDARATEVRRQVNLAKGYLVYAGDGQVLLKQVNVTFSLFETLPPRNHEEWLELGQKLEQYRRDFAPGDFEAMMKQFNGPAARIQGATLRDFRLTENGFRFVLELRRGFRWDSELSIIGASNLTPGTYLVQSSGESLSIAPLTPPFLSIRGNRLEFETQEITELNPVRVSATIENQGLQDVKSLRVRFYAEQNGMRQVLDEVEATVLGEGHQVVSTLWTPMRPGLWTIGVEVEARDERLLPRGVTTASAAAQVTVQPAPRVAWSKLLALGGEQPLNGLFVPALAASIATAGMALFLLLMRKVGTTGSRRI